MFAFGLSCAHVQAQDVRIIGGYNVGAFAYKQRPVQAMSYYWKRDYNMDFDVPNLLRGMYLGVEVGDYNWALEMGITNKKVKSPKSTFVNPTNSQDWAYKMRIRLRTFNLGFAAGTEELKFGASFDFGGFGVHEKSGPNDGFSNEKWDKRYGSVDLYTGSTFYLKIALDVIEIRPYYQIGWWYPNWDKVTYTGNNFGININYLFEIG